jgi:hypothetical protein
MYVIRKSGLRELDRPPLVNLWVLDKKTMRLTNYYRKYDEDVLEKSIKFSSVAEFAEEADTEPRSAIEHGPESTVLRAVCAPAQRQGGTQAGDAKQHGRAQIRERDGLDE